MKGNFPGNSFSPPAVSSVVYSGFTSKPCENNGRRNCDIAGSHITLFNLTSGVFQVSLSSGSAPLSSLLAMAAHSWSRGTFGLPVFLSDESSLLPTEKILVQLDRYARHDSCSRDDKILYLHHFHTSCSNNHFNNSM